MATRYTNRTKIPLSVALWLATDFYDGNSSDPNTFSVTTLLKTTRQIILTRRLEHTVIDVADLIAASVGTSFHDAIETAWRNHKIKDVLLQLGFSAESINRIKINPTEPTKEGDIVVWLEQRIYRKIGKYTISGKFDFIGDGILEDHKSTSVYNWMNGNMDEKYRMQGSIYRWIAPDKITKNTMKINFLFTDWKRVERYKQNYPKNKIDNKSYELIPMVAVETFLTNKLQEIENNLLKPESELPECTDDELWRGKPVYKYYTNPMKMARSNGNFDTYQEAMLHQASKGVGIVKEVKGKARACLYCSAFAVCTQKDRLIQQGILEVE